MIEIFKNWWKNFKAKRERVNWQVKCQKPVDYDLSRIIGLIINLIEEDGSNVIIKRDSYYTTAFITYNAKEVKLKWWNTNFPYAYAREGTIDITNTIHYKWEDCMPTREVFNRLYRLQGGLVYIDVQCVMEKITKELGADNE